MLRGKTSINPRYCPVFGFAFECKSVRGQVIRLGLRIRTRFGLGIGLGIVFGFLRRWGLDMCRTCARPYCLRVGGDFYAFYTTLFRFYLRRFYTRIV